MCCAQAGDLRWMMCVSELKAEGPRPGAHGLLDQLGRNLIVMSAKELLTFLVADLLPCRRQVELLDDSGLPSVLVLHAHVVEIAGGIQNDQFGDGEPPVRVLQIRNQLVD